MPAQDAFGRQLIPSTANTWNYGSTSHTISITTPYTNTNLSNHSHSISAYCTVCGSSGHTFPHCPNTPKEPEMTTTQKIAAERKEARERARLEALYTRFDNLMLDDLPDQSLLIFYTPALRKDTRRLTYAALGLRIGQDGALRWWITGRDGLNGGGTEDLLAWLIQRSVNPDDITSYEHEETADE